jgi:hypothetical protein
VAAQIYAKHQRGYLTLAVLVIDKKMNLYDFLDDGEKTTSRPSIGKFATPL